MKRIRFVLCCVFATGALNCAFGGIEIDGDRIVADTAHGRVIIDRGVVVELTNRLTGETYTPGEAAQRPTGLLWHKSAAWVDANAKVLCAKRGANEAAMSATLPRGHRLTMTVAIDPATQDVLIRQSASTGRKGLHGVQWGITRIDPDRVRALVPGYSGISLDGRCPSRDLKFHWPSNWEVQLMVGEGLAGGFAVWAEDADMRFKALHWRRQREAVTLGFQTHNFAPFDNSTSAESVEWRLAFFKGDWRVPAKRYRDWMERTYGLTRLERQRPRWVKDIRFLVIMGENKETLDALKTRVRPDATLLYIPAWRRDGYDKNYPDYTANERFPEFARYARALGYHVMPHMNYFGCDPKHSAYARFKQWHLRSPFTKDLMWWIPPRQRNRPDIEPTIKFAYINPASRAWRDDLTRRLVEAQRKYGFDAIHLDQTVGIINDANGMVDGLSSVQGNVLLHKQLREAMPDVALSGEGLDEVTCHHEAFAQRHAPRAVTHVFRTWDDGFIACGHPISSYFLTPYTKIYGYLGMCNPSSRELYLAWKRAYENWGVVPTYSRPSAGQINRPSGELRALLHETRTWVTDELVPDYDSEWTPRTKFRLRGRGNVAVICEADESGGSKTVRIAGGRRRMVYTIVKGQRSVAGAGTIADWFAYDEEKLFGLDPERTYVHLAEPRDPRAAHICRAPEDALIRVLMRDEAKFMVELEPSSDQATHDFIANHEAAETGVVIDERRGALDHGAAFQAGNAVCGNVMKRCIFAHPPWRVRAKGPVPGLAFGRYVVDLPADRRAVLEFAVGLRDGVLGRSDGVQFRVDVNDEAAFDEVWAQSKWKRVSVPMEKWRGRRVTVSFITTPGPKGNPSFDWACWGEPRIRFEMPPRRIDMGFACPKPVGFIAGSDPAIRWRLADRRDGMLTYNVNFAAPGRVVFLWAKPKPVKLPLGLAAEPFTVSLAVNNAPATPPIRHAGAGRGSGSSGKVGKRGISAHPPDSGRTSVDYVIRLPRKDRVTLAFAVGLRDGSKSDSIIFIVEANGRELYRRRVTAPDGWHPAEVDLSPYAGKPLLLSLVVDSDGPHYFDWAMWAEPVVR